MEGSPGWTDGWDDCTAPAPCANHTLNAAKSSGGDRSSFLVSTECQSRIKMMREVAYREK